MDYVNEKIPITPSGIEPVTIQLVTQCLNQLHHRVRPQYVVPLHKDVTGGGGGASNAATRDGRVQGGSKTGDKMNIVKENILIFKLLS
jgi:hypothetical protein